MIIRRRLLLLIVAALASVLGLHVLQTNIRTREPWDLGLDLQESIPSWLKGLQNGHSGNLRADDYTRILVVPALKNTSTSWFEEELPDMEKIVYVADDRTAKYHPPMNKGHEVMVYLTYIIDHYDALPDISIFLHPHRYSWHNNDLLENDAAQMIKRLNNARVIREGYMNLRCQWDPGCPHWLQPKSDEHNKRKQEQLIIAKSWGELFPSDPVPDALSHACCAQFAVSRQAIHALPISRYVWFRDWIMRTELSDYLSGRVFEYLWQYIFTGKHEVCPSQHACYCDGYGVCFPGPEAFQKWFEIRWKMIEKNKELDRWMAMDDEFNESKANGTYDALPKAERPQRPEAGIDDQLREEIRVMFQELADQKAIALRRGMDARIRAKESGLDWQEGDGF